MIHRLYVFISSGTFIGLVCFLSGFYLTRKEIYLKSSFDNKPNNYSTIYEEQILQRYQLHERRVNISFSMITQKPKQKKIFLFIIDALRLDFVTSDNFPLLYDLFQTNSTQCLFYKFLADPPTTTSQRLKAMTTGSMPTFIDFSSNFNSSAILEDNIIDQMKSSGMKIITMGDDTWASLFPTQFDINIPFDSFNTKDLHTVDDGIIANMWKYLNHSSSTSGSSSDSSNDWDLFITHFLGVDHIGHTYHAFHPLMREKLLQMDSILSEVIASLPPDSVLFMFGDHGMTDDGNHGGATKQEVESALFVFSTEPLHSRIIDNYNCSLLTSNSLKTVHQIDLVPTISLLMGLPIPFSSVGAIIPELFNNSQGGLCMHLAVNCLQLSAYFKTYFNIELSSQAGTQEGSEIAALLGDLDRVFRLHAHLLSSRGVIDHDHLEDTAASQGKVPHSTSLECQNCSTHSSAASIYLEGVGDPVSGLPMFCVPYDDTVTQQIVVAMLIERYVMFLSSAAELARSQWTRFHLPLMLFGTGLLLIVAAAICSPLLAVERRSLFSSRYVAILAGFVLFHMLSSLSNSFIVEEHWVHLYIVQSGFIFLFIDSMRYSGENLLSSYSLRMFLTTVASLLCVRSAWSMSEAVTSSSLKFDRFVDSSSLASFLLLSLILPTVTNVLVAASFTTTRFPTKSTNFPDCFSLLFSVNQCLLFTFFVINANRLVVSQMIFEPLNMDVDTLLLYIPRCIFSIFGLCLSQEILFLYLNRVQELPLISAVRLLAVCIPLVVLVTGAAASVIILLLAAASFLHLYAIIRYIQQQQEQQQEHQQQSIDSDHDAIFGFIAAAWTVHTAAMGRLCFFLTAHKFDFGTLHLAAGFVGAKDFHFAYAGSLLALNTFGFDLIFLLITVIGSFLISGFFPNAFSSKITKYTLSSRIRLLDIALFYRILVLIGSVLAALVHRRHLMVWRIFAPKLFFEAAFFLVYFILHAVSRHSFA